jgi:hypothetical protein
MFQLLSTLQEGSSHLEGASDKVRDVVGCVDLCSETHVLPDNCRLIGYIFEKKLKFIFNSNQSE